MFGRKILADLSGDPERLLGQLVVVNGGGFGPFQNLSDFMKAWHWRFIKEVN